MSAATTAMPPELERWVTSHCQGMEYVTDVSSARPDSRVWRVHAGARSVYAKISPSPRHYQREIFAYRHAAAALGFGGAPRLLATDPRLGALITTALPGAVVEGLEMRDATERAIHRLAGGLLRRWHDLARPGAGARAHARADTEEKVAASGDRLARVSYLLSAEQRAVIHRAQSRLPHLVGQLPLGFRHGDFRPRNWQWDAPRRVVGVFDFESSGPGVVVEDFVWLARIWGQSPHLRTAFHLGYGRDLTPAEAQALDGYGALAALEDLHRADRCDDALEITRAQLVLSRLVPRLQ